MKSCRALLFNALVKYAIVRFLYVNLGIPNFQHLLLLVTVFQASRNYDSETREHKFFQLCLIGRENVAVIRDVEKLRLYPKEE